jgi:hypothetical protein
MPDRFIVWSVDSARIVARKPDYASAAVIADTLEDRRRTPYLVVPANALPL